MSFSELLKQCRKKQGVSQAELASRLGVTQQAVGKWESGKSSPDPSTVARIAELLNTTADYLLGLYRPDAETFSWDCDTTPVKVTGYKPTAHMELDSTKVPQAKMEKLLNILYGTANTTPYLPLPDEVIKLMTT